MEMSGKIFENLQLGAQSRIFVYLTVQILRLIVCRI